jgi:subtilase family protein
MKMIRLETGKSSMRTWLKVGGVFAVLAFAGQAAAQLPVPPVQLPPVQTPASPLPGELVNDAQGTVDRTLRRLAQAREIQIDRLVRDHRAELDRDPAGELVVRAEVVAIDITEAALQRALAASFLVRRTQKLADLGVQITVLQTPEGWTAKRGLKKLRELDPAGIYDFNHVYLQGGSMVAALQAAGPPAREGTVSHGRVGLIDGGVDQAHQVFRQVRFQSFGCDGQALPSAHGTAVAALLTVSEIFSADVYCGKPTGGAVDSVAAALAWLARERVAVINISLVGPRNALLERSVHSLVARGFLIVAAVGNDGPAAPPLYPASYAGVVGVTAVDSKHRVLVEACRGEQVDFAARGSDMQAASRAPDAVAPVRGTSFAAPIVASLLAADLAAPDLAQRDLAIEKWAQTASDLGKKGRDEVYGLGEIGNAPGVLAGAPGH